MPTEPGEDQGLQETRSGSVPHRPQERDGVQGGVLVTGGAGFIGSAIVDLLAADKRDILVLDDFSTGTLPNLEDALSGGDVVIERADVRDRRSYDIIVARRPEVILHLAGQIDVRRSVQDPMLDASINVLGTLNVLQAAIASGVRKVVLASSGGSIYGDGTRQPVSETDRCRPRSPYGIGKRVLHDYLDFYRDVHGLRSTVLALGNVYGPRQNHLGEAGVVSIFLGRMLQGLETMIFGDGSQTRDFVFVGDVAEAFVRAIDLGDGVLNIGTGVETSIDELWRLCARVSKHESPPRYRAVRPGELQRNCLNCERAGRELKWNSTTSLLEGLTITQGSITASLGSNPGPNCW